MPRGDWDQLSLPALRALEALAAMPNGAGRPSEISPKVRMTTWRSLMRYAQVRTPNHEDPTETTIITITEAGKEAIGAGTTNQPSPEVVAIAENLATNGVLLNGICPKCEFPLGAVPSMHRCPDIMSPGYVRPTLTLVKRKRIEDGGDETDQARADVWRTANTIIRKKDLTLRAAARAMLRAARSIELLTEDARDDGAVREIATLRGFATRIQKRMRGATR